MAKNFLLEFIMKNATVIIWILLSLFCTDAGISAELPISEATAECIDCHSSFQPGIVHDWQNSRHARMTPKEAMAVEGVARKVSSTTVPENLQTVVVGCAECHTLRPEAHADTFEHNGFDVHVVVSPDDCQTCHVTERKQYSKNIMAHAYGNLADNKNRPMMIPEQSPVIIVTAPSWSSAGMKPVIRKPPVNWNFPLLKAGPIRAWGA
jgi:hypothetical protein